MMQAADPIVLEPGSPEWQREITASKVPAIIGLSPYDSPYSMWFQIAGYTAPSPTTPAMLRGHALEGDIARWGAKQHGLRLRPGRCWRNREYPWMVASPDRLCYLDDGRRIRASQTPWAIMEVKTAADWEKWGPDGSDEIPPYHRAQALWQCAVLGVPRCLVVALLPRITLRTYWVIPQPGEIPWLRDTVDAYRKTIEADQPPDIDSHDETYRVIRELHPEIEERDETIPDDDAEEFVTAHRALRIAEERAALATNRLADRMGLAHRALLDGVVIAHRIPTTKSPYVKPAKRLPIIEKETDA